MQNSIDNGWFGFFDPTDRPKHSNMQDDGSAALKMALAEHNARHAAEPPDKPDKQPETCDAAEKAVNPAQQILATISAKKKFW